MLKKNKLRVPSLPDFYAYYKATIKIVWCYCNGDTNTADKQTREFRN